MQRLFFPLKWATTAFMLAIITAFVALTASCLAAGHLQAATTTATILAQTDSTTFLPLVSTNTRSVPLAARIGYGLTASALSVYTDVADLGAGWYLDWGVRVTPERPAAMEYVQMIRVHQKLACAAYYHSDRNVCPYATPLDYVYAPGRETIEAAAIANPGSLWLIGNEMDRIDWAYCTEWQGSHCKTIAHSGQDEILPETYAVAYHDLYTMIKAADPTARVAIGGVIQATPLRLQYLTAIWDHYQAIYTDTMPVDVWNVHNFIIQEQAHSWGADIPAGITATVGSYVDEPQTHIDLTIFDAQIRAFRQWMKDRGQQHKPLIVSEYGVLFHNGLMGLPANDAEAIRDFMTDTFDYFYNTKDCTLGDPSDQCRLVQMWNWYSLDDIWGSFNPYARLYDPNTKQMTVTGERFRAYISER